MDLQKEESNSMISLLEASGSSFTHQHLNKTTNFVNSKPCSLFIELFCILYPS